MKAEQAKKLADDALGKLASALEHGQSEALTTHLAMMARSHRYSFRKVMLIAMRKSPMQRTLQAFRRGRRSAAT